MWINLISMDLDDDTLIKRLNDKNDSFEPGDVLDVLIPLISDILYSMFFEDPGDNLCCVIITDYPDVGEEIQYTVNLETRFYNKHIGKFLEDIQRKIMNDILVKFVTGLEKIDWRTI